MTESFGVRQDNERRPSTPPGTVYFGEGRIDLDGAEDGDGHIILQPRPSNDPNEPLNWPTYQKAINLSIACLFTLMVFATLDVGTVIWPSLTAELGYRSKYLNDSYAAGLAGLAIGCIFFIPAAVLFGRKPVYIFASLAMVLVNIGQALFQTRVQYIVLQVLAGLAGSVNDTIVQMTIVDLFFVHQRATMNGIYSTTVVIGTYLSLIPAGYIIKSQGWRWVWWWCAILNALVLLLIIFAYEETKYGKPTGNCYVGEDPRAMVPPQEKHPETPATHESKDAMPPSNGIVPSMIEEELTPKRKTYYERMTTFGPTANVTLEVYWQHMWRPFLLLFRIPAVPFAGMQYSLMMCWVAILAMTQPILFAAPPYNFSSVGVGNINIAPFLGAVIGSIYGGPLNDYYVVYMARRRAGIYDPELRLHMLLAPLIICPLGLFLYGTSIANEQPFIIPLVGSTFVGFGIGSVTSIILPYFGDSYRELVAEGLVVITIIRNVVSTAISFVVNPWMSGLGVQNMFISAGCLCFGTMIFVIPMIIWGRKARSKTTDFYLSVVARG
ncbi:major facilitator superfamily domain-containing protein [Aspergillus alliaceus]|uniref:major facilitator superfamily domain-containing protein n=1 Tax=Petromyces alliaceus TaxID=209559 RepID=UPI0012A57217|nr:major facilitator superfamily domain-containing protein [Aspergillus alliaceus]KAB8230236.1 major facilitator superfamily domain-containing protein [Aspergillus alliaceus]